MKGMLGSLLLVAALIACAEPQPGPPAPPGPPRISPSPPGPPGTASLVPPGLNPPYCANGRYTTVPTPSWLWYLGCSCRPTSSYPYVYRCEGQCYYTGWYPVGGYGEPGRVYKYCYCCAPTGTTTVSKSFECSNMYPQICPLPRYIDLKYLSATGCSCQDACIP